MLGVLTSINIKRYKKSSKILENKDKINYVQIVGRHDHYKTGYIGRSINPARCTKVNVIKYVDFHMRVYFKDGTSELLEYVSENSSLCRELKQFLSNPGQLKYNRMGH